ncbi:MAG: tetratricopeptide repeat protein [bacterium]|nr:tetratricopeptide repeat protein [bacterium]
MHKIKQKKRVNTIPGGLHYTPNHTRHRSGVKRYTICALILSLSALTAYTLSLRLISQIHYLRAGNFMQHGYYGLALQALQKASIYQPGDYKIQRQLGNAVYKLAERNPTSKGAYASAEKAGAHYQEAFRLNPIDAQSAYGLAWQEDRLELLYSKLHPDDNVNPHNARSYYEQAIRLRPNGIRYHYALVRYLHRNKKVDDLHFVVRRLTRIFPPAYKHLKNRDILSPALKAACRQGLQEAIKDNILPAAAHMALVDLATGEKDWASAIAHYQRALQLQPRNETDQAHVKLGRLFLKSGDVQAARDSFIKSLSLSRTREKSLKHLYRVFKKEGMLKEFISFFYEIQRRFTLPAQNDIVLVQACIDLKQYDIGRQVIEEWITNEPSAEAYYWLAQVAGKEKDWDRMERAIQKATVLEPENYNYRRIFFKLLKRKKKFESAELQLDLMIDNSEVASVSLFVEKAWLRWNQKDYDAALQAWQSAIRLKPDYAEYYARAAEAYVMIGDWSKAVQYYRKATGLDPRNKQYKKRYQQIMGNDVEGS